MAEAEYRQTGDTIDWVADATYTQGAIIQLRDGRAGVVTQDCVSGDTVGVKVRGLHLVQKTTSMLVLMGSRLYWDHSANKAHLLQRNDRDFYLGCAQGGGPTHLTTSSAGVSGPTIAATAAGTSVVVDLNVQPSYTLSLDKGFVSAPVVTAGINHQIIGVGEGVNLIFDTTAEAQKLDALSIRGMAPGALAIVETLVCINTNGDDAAFDLNIGLGNGTHATDADSITEFLGIHIDGSSTNICQGSRDGTTTVAITTDTTVDFTAGTPFLVQWDLSNTADIQAYIDGVNVNAATEFKLNAATGPLKLLAHMEKSSNDSPGNVSVMMLGARTAQV